MATFYDYQKNILSSGGGGGEGFSSSSAQLLNGDDICEGFAIDKFGNPQTHSSFGCTSFISCKGAKKMSITRIVTSSSPGEYGLAFYDEGKGFLSFVPSKAGTNGFELSEISIPNDAVWFKATYWNFDKSLMYGSFSCNMESTEVVNNKRPYQEDLIFFSQKVNQAVDEFWNNPLDDLTFDESYKATTGVLLLPSSYTPNGEKTKLIVYCHGYSHAVFYGTWGSTETFIQQKHHWADEGFAVMDCNGAYHTTSAQGANDFSTSPQNCEAYIKSIRWVMEHYNVEDTIYLIGGSMGGQPCMQLLHNYRPIIRACVLLEPHCNAHYWMQSNNFEGKLKTRLKPLFGITDTEYGTGYGVIDANKEKFIGYIPEWRFKTINDVEILDGMPPTRLIFGNSYTWGDGKRTIEAIRNAGGVATMRKIALAHSTIVSGANMVVDTEVINFFKRY